MARPLQRLHDDRPSLKQSRWLGIEEHVICVSQPLDRICISQTLREGFLQTVAEGGVAVRRTLPPTVCTLEPLPPATDTNPGLGGTCRPLLRELRGESWTALDDRPQGMAARHLPESVAEVDLQDLLALRNAHPRQQRSSKDLSPAWRVQTAGAIQMKCIGGAPCYPAKPPGPI